MTSRNSVPLLALLALGFLALGAQQVHAVNWNEDMDPYIFHEATVADYLDDSNRDFMWRGVVKIDNNGGTCTGALVHPQVVLTAAHCIMDTTKGELLPLEKLKVSVTNGHGPLGDLQACAKGNECIAPDKDADMACMESTCPDRWAACKSQSECSVCLTSSANFMLCLKTIVMEGSQRFEWDTVTLHSSSVEKVSTMDFIWDKSDQSTDCTASVTDDKLKCCGSRGCSLSGTDVALLYMSEAVDKNLHIPSYPIMYFDLIADDPALVVGFGSMGPRGSTSALRGATGRNRVGLASIQVDYTTPDRNSTVFRAGGPSSHCSGDSGAPIFVCEAARWVIAGVTHGGDGKCNDSQEGGGYYTRTNHPNVTNFIADTVEEWTGGFQIHNNYLTGLNGGFACSKSTVAPTSMPNALVPIPTSTSAAPTAATATTPATAPTASTTTTPATPTAATAPTPATAHTGRVDNSVTAQQTYGGAEALSSSPRGQPLGNIVLLVLMLMTMAVM